MDCRKFIKDCGAILNSTETEEHYKYASGKHGGIYIEKSVLLKNPIIASQLANKIVNDLCECSLNKTIGAIDFITDIDVFLGAIVGGAKFANYIALSYLDALVWITAAEFPVRHKVLCIEAEKEIREHFVCDESGIDTLRNKTLILKRNYAKDIKGKKVFIVEDIINSGATVTKLIELVVAAGGEVIGIGCIWNRDDFKSSRIPLISLVNEKLPSWEEKDCPFCKKGIPLSKTYGHG